MVIALRVFAIIAGASALQLHIKAGPDGRSVGDCPFAHAVRICCEAKQLQVEVLPHGPMNKPQWLVDDYGGKMPALVSDDGEVVTESRVIVSWLEGYCAKPQLEGLPNQEVAEQVAGPVFGAFARYCKSTSTADDAEDKEKKKALLLALCNLDSHLQQTGQFMAGAQLSTVDAFLLPALYHIRVAGAAYKDFEIPFVFDALHQYMDRHLASPIVSKCTPSEAMVRWGWANARDDTEAADTAKAELDGAMA